MNWRAFQALQHVMELDDHYLSFVDHGKGEPLLLIHGIPTWGFLWSGLLDELGDGYRVLVPDLLGYGASDRGDAFDRSVRAQAEVLDRWMQKLDVEQATVAGHDIGGAVALHLAVRFPHRVSRLCLVDSAAYDSWPNAFLLRLGHPGLARRGSTRTVAASLRRVLRRGFLEAPPAGFLDGLVAPYETEAGERSLVRNAAALDPNHTLELGPLLDRISAPTLILWGARDPFQPVECGERLAGDIPDSRLLILRKAGHFVMTDQPDRLRRALISFCATPTVETEPGPSGAFGRRAS